MAQHIILYNDANGALTTIQAEHADDGGWQFTGLEGAGALNLPLAAAELPKRLARATTAQTFALKVNGEESVESMTYGQWEALRCAQANKAVQSKIDALAVDAPRKAQIKRFFDSFTDGMRIKYTQGARSWGQIYGELLDDFSASAATNQS